MPARRHRIPSRVRQEVLFRSNHTCCICRDRGRDVQIHHIDSNRTNNSPDNLAVVCLDCHSRITGARGLGQRFTSGEVRQYKRSWEQQVLASRRIHRPILRYRKELISQIDLMICEVLASSRDSSRCKALLDQLYELYLWRGNREIEQKILEGLSHLALMSGLGDGRLAGMVAEQLWQLCWHFVGPQDVPMNATDLRKVLGCIDALETLSTFNCEFGHSRKAAQATADHAEHFFEIGLWYARRRIANAVISLYEKGLHACYTRNRLEFRHGYRILRRSIRRNRRVLLSQQPLWLYQRRRFDRLLRI